MVDSGRVKLLQPTSENCGDGGHDAVISALRELPVGIVRVKISLESSASTTSTIRIWAQLELANMDNYLLSLTGSRMRFPVAKLKTKYLLHRGLKTQYPKYAAPELLSVSGKAAATALKENNTAKKLAEANGSYWIPSNDADETWNTPRLVWNPRWPLRPEQRRALGWMLRREGASNLNFDSNFNTLN